MIVLYTICRHRVAVISTRQVKVIIILLMVGWAVPAVIRDFIASRLIRKRVRQRTDERSEYIY